ncbi:hypothetical protein FB470_001956 [Amycolatopsis thermophila]|uniref:Uncharacterized protein n=1 Tax=Amycolatopsis thermophila TaxID=206084 RepID=A0ABU0ET25_9PSEU|nr:hypothetical protein [Amycolatopsis thermophila]
MTRKRKPQEIRIAVTVHVHTTATRILVTVAPVFALVGALYRR